MLAKIFIQRCTQRAMVRSNLNPGDDYFANKPAESLVKGLAGLQVALWEWDLVNDFVVISEQYAQMLGFAHHELAQLDLAAFKSMMHPEDVASLQARIDKAISSDQILNVSRATA